MGDDLIAHRLSHHRSPERWQRTRLVAALDEVISADFPDAKVIPGTGLFRPSRT